MVMAGRSRAAFSQLSVSNVCCISIIFSSLCLSPVIYLSMIGNKMSSVSPTLSLLSLSLLPVCVFACCLYLCPTSLNIVTTSAPARHSLLFLALYLVCTCTPLLPHIAPTTPPLPPHFSCTLFALLTLRTTLTLCSLLMVAWNHARALARARAARAARTRVHLFVSVSCRAHDFLLLLFRRILCCALRSPTPTRLRCVGDIRCGGGDG